MTDLEILNKMIEDGSSLEEARGKFPFLTKSSYLRLTGGSTNKSLTKKPGSVAKKKLDLLIKNPPKEFEAKLFVAAREMNIKGEDKRVVYNSLFGDGCISGGISPYYLESHAFSQSPYLWMKASLLGSSLSNVRLHRATDAVGKEDLQMHSKEILQMAERK